MRGRAVVARKVHTLEVVGSNPSCAITNIVAICRIEQTRSKTSVRRVCGFFIKKETEMTMNYTPIEIGGFWEHLI